MGIRKDIKKYIKELQPYSLLNADSVIKRLNEILENNKKEKARKRLRNEYIMVKALDINDDGDTWEAIRDGHGVPPIGYRYIKVKK